jgi:predicted acyl esterase
MVVRTAVAAAVLVGLAAGADGAPTPVLLPAATAAQQTPLSSSSWPSTRSAAHRIPGAGGVVLQGYSVVPFDTPPGAKLPVILFVNSWAVSGLEYSEVATRWAARGYVCVQYAARGWYGSTGLVDVAGPDNVADASAVIDWVERTFPRANTSAVGMAGISYGAVVSQLTAAQDRRVRAIAAMSGTSDAMSDLSWHGSVALVWGSLLVLSGELPLVGREAPEVRAVWGDLL